MTVREDCRGIQMRKLFAMETAFEYKYQIATETVEQNTSKKVSAKKTTLQNMCKYSNIYIYI